MYASLAEHPELSDLPRTLWSTGPADVGLMTTAEPVQIKAKSEYRPVIRQYPLKPDAEKGIEPVINDMLKAGILKEKPDARCNSPIFPVKKVETDKWRLVQDLRAVNSAVQSRAPCVPDPYTLLNELTPEKAWFTVIDLSNAFFSIPLHEDSQDWFAFTYRGKHYAMTRIAQGFVDSPTIFSQAIQSCLSTLSLDKKAQILVYVDDILVAAETEDKCREASLAVLKHLAQTGNKVSLSKLQWVKQQVVYLGHTVSHAGRSITDKRMQTVAQFPKPRTKKEVMSFLGLCNYNRMWVPNYAEMSQPLLDLAHSSNLKMTEKVEWNSQAESSFVQLKQALQTKQALPLPDYSKPFIQMVDCKNGFMTSVLLQTFGTHQRALGYYSKRLDSVTQAMPNCVQAVCAAALAVTATAELVLFHPLTLKVPHAVSVLLLQTKMTFLSPARHLSCIAVLLSQPHITMERCNTLNPATLMPTPDEGTPHDCIQASEQLLKPRPDLQDEPLLEGDVVFVDGSSSKDETGKTRTGYAVVTPTTTVKAGKLPSHYSAQAAELVALTEACKAYQNRAVTIYTDSQYAFSTVHLFAAQWARRGFTTSTGKPVKHAQLLQLLLDAVKLPSAIAICKCAAHQTDNSTVTKGNNLADKAAKLASHGAS